MRRFVSILVFYFLFPLLIMATTVELILRNIPNDYKYKREYMENHAAEIETLVLGNSHTFRGVDPAQFSSKTFNLASVSQPIFFDYYLLEKYKERMSNLKTIILPISYFSLFATHLDLDDDAWRVKNYQIYYKIRSSYSIKSNLEILSTENQISLERFKSYYIHHEDMITCTPLGSGKRESQSTTPKGLIESGKIAAERHTKDIHSKMRKKYQKENTEFITQIISWAQEKNIQIILILPPAFESYRHHLNREQLDLTIHISKSFADKYDNCSYYNLLEDTLFTEDDFYDGDHLGTTGTQKLSNLLNNMIEEQK